MVIPQTLSRRSLHPLFNMENDRKHFYVTLFSNASQKPYNSNTLKAFRVHAAQQIDLGLTDKWEVGVCELTCHPPRTGTFRGISVVCETNALIFCDLITQQLMGIQYVLFSYVYSPFDILLSHI
jgi:hypothetical protein